MVGLRKLYPIFRRSICKFLVTWLLASFACAQAPKTKPTTPPTNPSGQLEQNAPSTSLEPAEPKISAKETEELFRSVDDILKFSSQDSGLPIKTEVKRKLASRDEVVAYLQQHMSEDEDSQRLQRSELVLKKFGLIPRDFDLQKYLVAILREQVAGYYDPKAKIVNMLDWVDTEQQKPVMAHELTHALQDQSFGLEEWMRAGAADLADKRNDVTPEDIENDEVSTAR